MTRKGVWNLQQTRDKYLQSLWANDFHLYGWGYNADGTVGNNTRSTTRFSSPIQIGTGTNWSSVSGKQAYYSEYYRLQTKTDGTLWSWGRNDRGQLGLNTADDKRSSPTQIPGTTWTSNLSIGYRSSSCIKTDATLWPCGQGYYGML